MGNKPIPSLEDNLNSKVIHHSLCWILATSLAFGSPLSLLAETKQNTAAGAATEAPPAEEVPAATIIQSINPLQAEALTLKSAGQDLYIRAKYGDVAGIQGNIYLTEMDQYEREIELYGQKVLNLARRDAQRKDPVDLTHQSLGLLDYFEHVSRALAIRMLADSTFEDLEKVQNWMRSKELQIKLADIADGAYVESMAKVSLAYDKNQIPFTVKIESSSQGSYLLMQLKSQFVGSYIEQRLAQSPELDDIEKTAAFIASSMLVDNYYMLQLYSGKSLDSEEPLVGSRTLEAFPSLKLKKQDWQSRYQWLQSTHQKKALFKQSEALLKILTGLGSKGFVADDQFVIGLLDIMNPEQSGWFFAEDDIVIAQVQAFQELETEQTLPTFDSFLMLTELPPVGDFKALAKAVVTAWSQAKISIFRSSLLNDSELTPLQRRKLTQYLNEAEERLIATRDQSPIMSGLAAFLSQTVTSASETIQADYREMLIKDSRRLSELQTDKNIPVDLALLGKALESEMAALRISGGLRNILNPILNSETYTMAQLSYHKVLVDILQDNNFSVPESQKDADVDPTKSEELLALLEQWSWKSSLKESHIKRTAHYGKIEETQRKKDLINYVKVGQLFGFFRSVTQEAAQLKDLNLSPEALKAYQEALKEKLLFQFPILANNIPEGSLDRPSGKKFNDEPYYLWQFLTDPSSQKKVVKRVGQHLEEISNNIKSNLLTIEGYFTPRSTWSTLLSAVLPDHYTTNDSYQFKKMVSESVVMAHRLQSHPMFFELYGEFARQVDGNSTAGDLWRTFYHNYVELGFVMLIGYQLVQFFSKFVFPRFSSFIKSMEIGVVGPYLPTFMGTAMGFIGIDLANGYYENYHRNPDQMAVMQQFYYSTAKDNAFFKFEDVVKKQKHYDDERVAYLWEVAMLGGFIVGLSIILPIASKVHTAVRIARAKKNLGPAFERIGFQKERVSFFEAEIDAVFAATLKEIGKGPYPHIMKARVRAEHQKIIAFVQKEQAYWNKLALRNKYQFEDLGLAVGEWNPQKVMQAAEKAKTDLAQGNISLQRYQVIKHSAEKLQKVMQPEVAQMAKDPFTLALYQRIWNVKSREALGENLFAQRYAGEYHPEGPISAYTQAQAGYKFETTKVKTRVNGKEEEVEIFSPVRTEEYKYDAAWKRDIEEMQAAEAREIEVFRKMFEAFKKSGGGE